MVRAPCCEKTGLRKGPWSPEEDKILTGYIRLYGHSNWRALPKQAGLLRCGKSCRLRWTNYLRPDIKRGNFTAEEEDAIVKLHEELGNRWSIIAANLPGRTDNEIKNVWHTHLKKRIRQRQDDAAAPATEKPTEVSKINEEESRSKPEFESFVSDQPVNSPPRPDSDTSSVNTGENENISQGGEIVNENLPHLNEDFWTGVFSLEESDATTSDFPAVAGGSQAQWPSSPPPVAAEPFCEPNLTVQFDDSMEIWYRILTRGGELEDLLA
ncbi:hypothetical protein Nepgr_029820 [Nepenthes gracilis]|uniref:Uncharacterized protein n=1 Tax=Nepenthes gracilis TaxID=150966 RepID=A0AAD3TG14_NEPGR|nr:hypothetical protein Nepgr_029820 [Nepenthes gracilis]